MESLPPLWRIVVSGLVGLYLAYVVIDALRTGTYRYRGRTHPRATDGKVFWLGVSWFAFLAILTLGYAVMVGLGRFGASE